MKQNMDNYLKYLIEDIRNAAQFIPVSPISDLPEKMEWYRGTLEFEITPERPMQEWFQLSKENFPPVHKLKPDQIELLVKELLNLWDVFNFKPVIPENLPADICYELLVDALEKPVIWVSDGMIEIEFCQNNPETCPFPPEYCKCREEFGDGEVFTENRDEIKLLEQEIKDIIEYNLDNKLNEKKMQKYVDQLILDLEKKAEEKRSVKKAPDNVKIRSGKNNIDMLLNPFQTLEEISGIDRDFFPDSYKLSEIQTRRILIAILHFLDAYRIKLHQPEDIPADVKYDVLIQYWDFEVVKDLPVSGDDIDLCTGEPETCPYWGFCNCEEEFDDELDFVDLPQKESPDDLPFDDLPFGNDSKDTKMEDDDTLPF